MGIGTIALNVLKAIPRYAFSDGCSVITKARKGVRVANPKAGYSIFSHPIEKGKAGLTALKKDLLKAGTKKTVWQSITSFAKSFVTKPKAGIRAAKIAAAKAGKTASFWAKAGGALKGLGKVCKKLPIIGTVLTVGFEIPDVVKAFTHKDGGFVEGMKQIGKSALKIGVGAGLCAVGTAIGGPVVGALAWAAGDWIVDKVTGGSFSENHPDENVAADATRQTIDLRSQETQDEQTSQGSATESAEVSDNTSSTSSTSTDTDNNTDTDNTDDNETTDTQSSDDTTTQQTQGSDDTQTQQAGTNPQVFSNNPFAFGLGTTTTNPFMMGGVPTMGTTPLFGMGFNSGVDAYTGSLVQSGENIFEKYPMGYTFQYIG